MAIENIPNAERRPIGNAHAGTITTDVESVQDGLTVSTPTVARNHEFGPCRWMPRIDDEGALVLPSRGDAALIIIDEVGDPWVVCWWPEEYDYE